MDDSSAPGVPLSCLARWFVVSKELLVQGLKRALRPVRRDAPRVRREYDAGTWKDVLDRKDWRRAADLESYVIPEDPSPLVAKIDGRLVRVRADDYYRFRTRRLQDLLREQAGDAEELVELGCGTGGNLFALSLRPTWRRLVGMDVSPNGIAAAREIAAHFRVEGLEFDVLDLTRPDDPALPKLGGRVVFTYYCLEQLKRQVREVIENLLRAKVRRVVHIEPTRELLDRGSPLDWITALYIARNDYLDNLLATLRDFETRGRLRILRSERLGYAPTPRNDPVLVRWEPT
jgi:SAM-dependent methyltransferase